MSSSPNHEYIKNTQGEVAMCRSLLRKSMICKRVMVIISLFYSVEVTFDQGLIIFSTSKQ